MKKVIHLGKISFVLLLIFGGVVNAQGRWEFVGTNQEGSRMYFDADSIIVLSRGRIFVWRKLYAVGKDRQKYYERELKGVKNAENFELIISRVEVDCPSMRERIHSTIYYTEDGNVIKRDVWGPSDWVDYPPGSVGEIFLKRICTTEFAPENYDLKEM